MVLRLNSMCWVEQFECEYLRTVLSINIQVHHRNQGAYPPLPPTLLGEWFCMGKHYITNVLKSKNGLHPPPLGSSLTGCISQSKFQAATLSKVYYCMVI